MSRCLARLMAFSGQVSGIAHRCLRLVFLHFLDEALGSHIGPVFLDEIDTGLTRVFFVRHGPARRHVCENRPERILALIVDQGQISAIFVFERISAQGLPLPSYCLGWLAFISSSPAPASPPHAGHLPRRRRRKRLRSHVLPASCYVAYRDRMMTDGHRRTGTSIPPKARR